MYRFVCTKVKVLWSRYGWWGLSEIELRDSGGSAMRGAIAEHPGKHPFRMDAPSAIDGTTRSFLDKPERGTAKKSATAANTPQPLVIKLSKAHAITGFRFRTLVVGWWNGWGKGARWSDPIQWQLEGSNDGEKWSIVQAQTSDYATPSQRAAWTEWIDVKSA